jgi:oxygen-independent coproporphyrinogen-3 oxidase
MDIQNLLARYGGDVPRYTSYPTAPHFGPAVDAQTYASWLAATDATAPVSLYLHIPFCDELCLYCGCSTTVARRSDVRQAYANLLVREIGLVADQLGKRRRVTHIHWGGGTPTALPARAMREVDAALRQHFDVDNDAEVAVELDPRHLGGDRISALAAIGTRRASFGVQDFDPKVQEAIGRIQSQAQTAAAVSVMRGIGARSINLDLIYGLPYQTPAGAAETARRALALAPDRVAVFGYAHVPWMRRRQLLLPEAALPGPLERFASRATIDPTIREAGFVAIGLDHYARPQDSLARAATEGRMVRNFQGYTTDGAPILLGFGASSIGTLPQGFVQNHTDVPAWREAITAGRLPVARGLAPTPEDRMRGEIIYRLLCDLSVNLGAVARRHNLPLVWPVAPLRAMERDGLLVFDHGRIRMREEGRPFLRSVAALFDTHLALAGRHSQAV